MPTLPISPSTLFSPELFERYNRLESVWNDIRRYRTASRALQHQLRDIEAIESSIEDVARKLSRQRFSVGFLGTSQAGKSTTLNNFTDQRNLLPEGDGRSCTSIRVRFFATDRTDGYHVRFIYLTKEAYRERRDDLACGSLQLYDREGDQQYSDDAVLEKLDLKQSVQENRHLETLLRNLIEAARLNRHLLHEGSAPHVAEYLPPPANDSEVRKILKETATHDGAAELKYALLDEIQVGVPGLALPDKLQLVDLPGLGTARAADSDYTMRAVRNLDAAIVAINFGGNLDLPENYYLVKELQEVFDRDARRVWIVGTKMDSVGPDRLQGADGKDFPRTLASVLHQHHLHLDQVSFVANTWFNQAEPTPRYVELNHKVQFENNAPILPETFTDYPALGQAYTRFCEDGGIQALKDVINGTMVDAIAEGMTKQIDSSIQTITARLRSAVTKARRSTQLGESGRALARKWRFAIDQVSHSVEQEARLLDDANPLRITANEVRAGMRDRLDEALKYANPGATGQDLAERFQDVAEEMYWISLQGFGASSELTNRYFNTVVERLKEAGEGTAVPAGIDDPVGQLHSLLQAGFSDSYQSRLMQDIQSLKERTLVDASGSMPISLVDFRRIMLKKIDQVVRQAQYRFHNFVRIQLQAVASDLRAMTPPEEVTEHVQDSMYDQLLRNITAVFDSGTAATNDVKTSHIPFKAAAKQRSSEQPSPHPIEVPVPQQPIMRREDATRPVDGSPSTIPAPGSAPVAANHTKLPSPPTATHPRRSTSSLEIGEGVADDDEKY